MTRILAGLAVFAAAVGSPAAAVTVIQQTVAIPTVAAPGASSIAFSQFDASLGTLVGITLSFEASSSTTINFANNTPSTRNWTITPGSSIAVSGNGFALSDAENGPATAFSLAPRFAPSKPRLGSATFVGSYADSDSLATGFLPYVGTGTISFAVARLANFAVVGGGGASTIGATPIGGTATLSYSYDVPIDSVPEPASWAMLIAGFGLVGAAARRRLAIPA